MESGGRRRRPSRRAGLGEFESYHRRILGREYEEFAGCLFSRPARRSLRVNTIKATGTEVDDFLGDLGVEYAAVPWCREGRWFFGADSLDCMEHQMGWFVLQEALSMAAVAALSPKPGEVVLDLCAAPGAKATQISAAMSNIGVLVANDDNYVRLRALVYSLQRCGALNAAVVLGDGVGFERRSVFFDAVLVDAPCSSVGTARKNPQVLGSWSLSGVERLSAVQRKLVSSAYRCLKEGGRLVYSTCTTSVEENEGVIEHLLSEFGDARLVRPDLRGLSHMDGLTESTRGCVRVLPHHNDTEAGFVAEVVKGG